jgi:hypothetical protein
MKQLPLFPESQDVAIRADELEVWVRCIPCDTEMEDMGFVYDELGDIAAMEFVCPQCERCYQYKLPDGFE